VIGGTVCALFLWRLWLPQVSLGWWIIGALLLGLGTCKEDLWTTFRRGKWWWLNRIEDSSSTSAKVLVIVLLALLILLLVFSVIQIIIRQ
jgi:hypothetical protein